MPEITTIIALVVGIILIFALSWYAGKDKNIIRAYRILDLSLLTFILFFIITRVLGLIFFKEGLPDTWSLLPITQPESEFEYLRTWPWVIFKIIDARFLFIETISAYTISEVFFMVLHGRRLKLIKNQEPRALAYVVSMSALIPLMLASYYNGYLEGLFEIPQVLIIAGINLVSIVAVIYLLSDSIKVKLVILAAQLLQILSFNYFYKGEKNILAINLILGILFVLHLLKTGLEYLVMSEDQKRVSPRTQQTRVNKHRFAYKKVGTSQNFPS